MHDEEPTPESSLQLPAGTAVELPVAGGARRDYLTGIAIGAAVFAVGAQLAYSFALADTGWSRFNPSPAPVYALVSSQTWRTFAPLVLALVVAGAHLAARGRRWPAFVALAITLAALAVTYYGARHPMGS